MHILDQEVPGLAQRLRALRPENQRSVVARASLLAAARLGDLDTATSQLLEVLRSQGELSVEQATSAMVLSEVADNKYFELQNKNASDKKCSNLFSEARLLRGLAVGFGASAQEDIADAVYELTKALDDPSEVIAFIQSRIGKPG